MKYAVVNRERKTAFAGGRGLCQVCNGETIAKCGQFMRHHWAHKALRNCDHWWENESDWHRDWKNQFPENWQEVICYDRVNGEKHVADIKTAHSIVVEFQHSLLTSDEMRSREQFYVEMVWVVDGLRNLQDEINFRLGMKEKFFENVWVFEWWGRGKLFERWCNATKPVFLDFRDKDSNGHLFLFHLTYFDPLEKVGAISPIYKHDIVSKLSSGVPILLPCLDQLQREEILATIRPPKSDKPPDPQLSLF